MHLKQNNFNTVYTKLPESLEIGTILNQDNNHLPPTYIFLNEMVHLLYGRLPK